MAMTLRGRLGLGLGGLLLSMAPLAAASQCHSIQDAAQQLGIDLQNAFEGSDVDSTFRLAKDDGHTYLSHQDGPDMTATLSAHTVLLLSNPSVQAHSQRADCASCDLPSPYSSAPTYILLTCYSIEEVADGEEGDASADGTVQPADPDHSVVQCEAYLPPVPHQQEASLQYLRGAEDASMFEEHHPTFQSVAPASSAETNSFFAKAATAETLFIDLQHSEVLLDSGSTASIKASVEYICNGQILLLEALPTAHRPNSQGRHWRDTAQDFDATMDAASVLFRSLRSTAAPQVSSSGPSGRRSHRRLLLGRSTATSAAAAGGSGGPALPGRRLTVQSVTVVPRESINKQLSGDTSATNTSSATASVGVATSDTDGDEGDEGNEGNEGGTAGTGTPVVEQDTPAVASQPASSSTATATSDGTQVPTVSAQADTTPTTAAGAPVGAPQAAVTTNSADSGAVGGVAPLGAATASAAAGNVTGTAVASDSATSVGTVNGTTTTVALANSSEAVAPAPAAMAPVDAAAAASPDGGVAQFVEGASTVDPPDTSRNALEDSEFQSEFTDTPTSDEDSSNDAVLLALAYIGTGILVVTAVMSGMLYRRRYRQHALEMQYSQSFTVHHNGLHQGNRPVISTGATTRSGAASRARKSPVEEAAETDAADEEAEGRGRDSPAYRAALESAHTDSL